MPRHFHGHPYWISPDDRGVAEYTLYDSSDPPPQRLQFEITWNSTPYKGELRHQPDGFYRGDFLVNDDGARQQPASASCVLVHAKGGICTLVGRWKQPQQPEQQWHDDLTEYAP